MSAVRIVRGTAALPPDVEERFVEKYGREMTPEERRFLGLSPETGKPRPEHYQQPCKAA